MLPVSASRRARRASALVAGAALGAAALTLSPPTSAAPSGDHPHGGGAVAAAIAALQAHPRAAHAGGSQDFHAVDTIVDPDGSTHVRLAREVQGVPVLGGDVVVHQGPGQVWDGVSQTLTGSLDLSVAPTLSRARAETQALLPAPENAGVSGLRTHGVPRLVVDALDGAPRLAWEVTTAGRRSDGTPSRLLTYVDADSGRVLRREETIETVDGSGSSLYSGTVPLQLTQSGSSYVLKDPTRGGTYTVDVKNQTDSTVCSLLQMFCPSTSQFTSADTSYGDGTTANRESAAVDAQYGTNMTWDYYVNVQGRQGIFGNGTGSYNRVHYGKNYVNAFWDGTKMTYGDGDGTSYGPLVSLDVAGHEMSHGVTENTAGLTYSGESGGLNESTSDIFGTMVEFYANNAADPGDYYIGEEFDLKNHVGFRRMDDPAKDGKSASCWSSGVGNLDVHYSSGVGNHFFYLLAEGSGPKTIGGAQFNSPTCNGSTVTGIGRTAAEKIWYRALTVYMTSGTNYAGARTATLNAARDLYGAGSSQYAAVAAAWSAVNVG
ncbi:MAG TPA: M4 family metallopeptidase [Nocardioides sp.]|nr:M4 family metallopeptidase [Nocardioides sp.]